MNGSNKMSIWAQQFSLEQANSAVKFNDLELLNDIIKLGANDLGEGYLDEDTVWHGINGKQITEYVVTSRSHLRNYLIAKMTEGGGDSFSALGLPVLPQLRTTRKIVGSDTISTTDANVEILNSVGAVPSWNKSRVIWQIPKGALIPQKSKNLFAAGRIISAEEGDAWEAIRSIAAVALTGEIAGKMATTSYEQAIKRSC